MTRTKWIQFVTGESGYRITKDAEQNEKSEEAFNGFTRENLARIFAQLVWTSLLLLRLSAVTILLSANRV